MGGKRAYELGTACSRLSSGKNLASSRISNEGGRYPVYGANGLRGYTEQKNFEGECALIGRQGAACGNVRYFRGKAWITEHAVIAQASQDNNTRYLAYLLSTMNLGRLSGQSAQPGLSVKTLAKQEILLPPLSEQLKVAEVLASLDEKIELNARINGCLEEMLLARYRDDFTGPITESWKKGSISDIGTVVGGATPSKKHAEFFCSDGIGWITPRDLADNPNKFISHGATDITQEGYNSCSTKLLPEGSVLFSSRAPVGYIAIADSPVATNQGFKSVVPRDEYGTAFVYCFLKENTERIKEAGSGTTFVEVSGKTMKDIELPLPDHSLCSDFSQWANPLLKQQATLEKESAKLAALRDALLPKLMSGEIDVSEVDITQPNSRLYEC